MLDERHSVRADLDAARWQLDAAVQELWASDGIRAVSPTVLDEVRTGLVYFTSTLVNVVPRFYRDLEAGLKVDFEHQAVRVPPFLTFGSWIGGDRDGNPQVTSKVTADALS